MVITLLLLFAINLPGNVARHVAEVHRIGNFELLPQYEHGWPLTHLVRQEQWGTGQRGFGDGFWFPTIEKCWRFWDLREKDELHGGRLAGNVAIGLTITILAGGLFEIWRRRHRSLFQVHLVDVGLATTAVAGVLGWYVAARTTHQREEAALAIYVDEMTEHGAMRSTMSGVEWEKRGPTWIRVWLGDSRFEVFDRVIAANPLTEKGVSSLAAFRELRKTSVECRDLPELARLSQFPQLEELDVALRVRTELGSGKSIRLPQLSNLRILTIRSIENRTMGLDQLPQLRVLNLQGSIVTAETLEEIGRLQKLRQLSLAYSSFPPEAIQHLRSLAELEELDLDRTVVNDDAIACLTDLPALKKLSLQRIWSTEESLRSIARFQSLEFLSLDNLTEAGLETLSNSPRLRVIYVSAPDREALLWPRNIYGWKINASLGDGTWIFHREERTMAKEAPYH